MGGGSRRTGVCSSVAELVGQTPLLDLSGLLGGGRLRVLAKLEMCNPAGSAKDRPALAMLQQALADGRVHPGGVVVESSSGNLGVALAQHCRLLGLRLVCVIDPRTSPTTRRLIEAYGGEVVQVDRPDPVTGDWLQARLDTVRRIVEATPGAWWPNQYANADNPAAHRTGAVKEVVDALGGAPRALFVATSSTGTLVGSQRYLRDHGHPTEVVAVDAAGSVLFGGSRGTRLLPGYGAGVVPPLAGQAAPADVVRVDDTACVVGCRRVARGASLLVGASAGGVVEAFLSVRDDFRAGDTVVLLFHDGGERYLDTVFDDAWVETHLGLTPALLTALLEAADAQLVA